MVPRPFIRGYFGGAVLGHAEFAENGALKHKTSHELHYAFPARQRKVFSSVPMGIKRGFPRGLPRDCPIDFVSQCIRFALRHCYENCIAYIMPEVASPFLERPPL